MKKLLDWFENHSLLAAVGFLLFFIPLWPKIPLIDIQHTWVYIRAEDFLVLAVLLLWALMVFLRKVSFQTPLTFPILLFWIIGGVSTIHSILVILPLLSAVYPNLALLNYLRHIEYLSVFFIAYSAFKDRRAIPYLIAVLILTFFLVFAYGLGQKFLGFPAYLTMNEEFAKGLGVKLSSQSRISSTFGGHYDLAAYLVLVLPIFASLIFAFKNWLVKLFLGLMVICGFVLLFMTVSRISFFVLLISLLTVLLFHKKKLLILFSFGVVGLGFLTLVSFSPSLFQRFGNTVKEVKVLLDRRTGEEIGQVKEIETLDLKDKTIRQKSFAGKPSLYFAVQEENTTLVATTSGIIPSSLLPVKMLLLAEPNAPTGENLPQGTGYTNLPLSPIISNPSSFLYQNQWLKEAKAVSNVAEYFNFQGDFLVKEAPAYDLSFTTRFQGEWPRTLDAFERNIFLGSGYSTVSLAVDNNYLRLLGEVGLLGTFSFLGLFFLILINIKKTLPQVNSLLDKSLVIGFTAGLFGLLLNALFIDVFEASKVAFFFWLLSGIILRLLSFYQKKSFDFLKEMKEILISKYAVITYLFFTSMILFSSIASNYFIGDDFTWLRWAVDRNGQSFWQSILGYFSDAGGFFYRPGTKVYFLLMYSGFWLNPAAYYFVSIFLHFMVAVLIFLIARKIFKDLLLSVLAAFFFLILSGHSEAIMWLSSTGHLFNALFILLGLFSFILWEEDKKTKYFLLSLLAIFLSLLFHELGIVAPLLFLLYKFLFGKKLVFKEFFKDFHHLALFLTILPYLLGRFLANSHWFNGDYSYNLLKLPYNFLGNLAGYLALNLIGVFSLPLYQNLRNLLKIQPLIMLLILPIFILSTALIYKKFIRRIEAQEQKIVLFCVLFFILSLLPFLGLGNLTSRYSYLSSAGFALLFAFFIKKLYGYLLDLGGRANALATITIVVSVFFLINLIQLQKVQSDWAGASAKTKKFLASADSLYSVTFIKEKAKLYFINVPIRQGEAWIFPTGLENALWFIFRNKNLQVFQVPSLEAAIETTSGFLNERILEFNETGGFIEAREIK